MRRLMLAGALLALLTLGTAWGAATNVSRTTIPQPVQAENHPSLQPMFRIYIENWAGGTISKVNLDGSHVKLGTVLQAASAPKPASDGFWAAHYDRATDGTHGCVTATAVNAIHLRVGPEATYDPLAADAWMPYLITLLPREHYDHDNPRSTAAIYTDISAGTALFGGWTAPFVGSPLRYLSTDGQWRPITEYFAGDYSKAAPKRLLIIVEKPVVNGSSPEYIEFENWAAGDTVNGITSTTNGRVLLRYPGGTPRHIADVLQRVQGTGRFIGSEYADVGRIRANHPGVIDLSTSPKVGYTTNAELRGGLQIIPANHAKYLYYNLGQTYGLIGHAQWMIVGPIGADRAMLADARYTIDGRLSFDPAWEAIAPLFAMYIRPKHIPGQPSASTLWQYSSDWGATWHDPPVIQGVTDPSTGSPVAAWTNLRIWLRY